MTCLAQNSLEHTKQYTRAGVLFTPDFVQTSQSIDLSICFICSAVSNLSGVVMNTCL